jgi:signal peptidase II
MPLIVLLLAVTLAIAADQASKFIVVSHLSEGQSIAIWPLRIRRLTNGSFGISDRGSKALAALWVFQIILFIAVVNYGQLPNRMATAVALGAALGGAASNVIDHWRHGGVVDYIDVGFWPIFNLADASISVGAVGALLLIFA